MNSNGELAKHVVDGFSLGTIVATIAGWLPDVAALFTVIWTALRIWETKTVQCWVKKHRKS